MGKKGAKQGKKAEVETKNDTVPDVSSEPASPKGPTPAEMVKDLEKARIEADKAKKERKLEWQRQAKEKGNLIKKQNEEADAKKAAEEKKADDAAKEEKAVADKAKKSAEDKRLAKADQDRIQKERHEARTKQGEDFKRCREQLAYQTNRIAVLEKAAVTNKATIDKQDQELADYVGIIKDHIKKMEWKPRAKEEGVTMQEAYNLAESYNIHETLELYEALDVEGDDDHCHAASMIYTISQVVGIGGDAMGDIIAENWFSGVEERGDSGGDIDAKEEEKSNGEPKGGGCGEAEGKDTEGEGDSTPAGKAKISNKEEYCTKCEETTNECSCK